MEPISVFHVKQQGIAHVRIIQLNLIGAVVITAFTAFLAQPVYADAVRSEIDAANAQFTALAGKGDGAGLAALYAMDGQLMPAGSEPIKGPLNALYAHHKDAVRAALTIAWSCAAVIG